MLALWMEGAGNCSQTSSSQTTSENLQAPQGPAHQGEPGLNHPELIPPQSCLIGVCTQSSIPTLRRDRDTEKVPVRDTEKAPLI
jgi:hypothetical protein